MGYKVIICGKLVPGTAREQAIQSLCGLFNSTPKKMEQLLQGYPVPLKKTYNQAEAEALRSSISEAGVLCRIVPEQQEPFAEALTDQQTIIDTHSVKQQPDEEINDSDPKTRDGFSFVYQYIQQYVGRNFAYYDKQFAKFSDSRSPMFKVTWHWPGFFMFSFWALYRKQWMVALINAAVSLFLFFYTSMFIFLAWLIVRAMTTNYFYFRIATKMAQQAWYSQDTSILTTRGGTSVIWLLLGVGGYLSILLLIAGQLAKNFVSQHEHALREVTPDSNSQLRGDGSSLVILEGEHEMEIASLTLSYTALTLKVLMISSKERLDTDEYEEFVDIYLTRIDQSIGQDPWGMPYRALSRENLVELVSAGPDRAFDTLDDIIQPVKK